MLCRVWREVARIRMHGADISSLELPNGRKAFEEIVTIRQLIHDPELLRIRFLHIHGILILTLGCA